jgi:hypothetical protein
VVVALLGTAALVGVPATSASAVTAQWLSGHDGRCLDADIAGGTHNGTRAQVWDCLAGVDQQKWHR